MENQSNDNLLMPADAELLPEIDESLFLRKKPKKYKILYIADYILSTSGVGVQGRMLIDGLLKTGKYSFRCFGSAIKHEKYEPIVINEDLIIRPINGFGTKEQIKHAIITEKPDCLFIFTDPRQFIHIFEMEDEIRQICPIVYWHVWDNDPYPDCNTTWYKSIDLINCISKKTYDLVKPKFPEKTNYIPHAFPKQIYYPIPNEQVNQLKAENFGDRADWFKALWVNRNAHRKVPSDVLSSWKLFLDNLQEKHGHKNAVLIMHTQPKDIEGPDLYAVTQHLGIEDHVFFSQDKLDFNQMNILHNVSDCLVNISKAEGWGLSSGISLMVGKPIIVGCTGGESDKAIDPRDGKPNGVALNPIKRLLVGSQMVPYIYEDLFDTREVADGFMKIFEMTPEEKEAMKVKCVSFADEFLSYDKMIADWDRTLTECIDEFKTKKKESESNNESVQWDMIEVGINERNLTNGKEEDVSHGPTLAAPLSEIKKVERKGKNKK